MAKQAKFFCDFCGTEVRQNDKFCKHCGKFFSSVKCPSCNHVGSAKEFAQGCPYCGYAGTGSLPQEEIVIDEKKNRAEDPLPVWIYAVSLCVLGAVLYFIFSYFK